MSSSVSKFIHLSQYLYFSIGLLNLLYGVIGGLTLFVALQLRKNSRFQVHRLLYGFSLYFFVLAVFSDLYRFKWFRPILLFRFQTFALYQYTVSTLSLIIILGALLWFCSNYFLKRIDYDHRPTDNAK